MINRVLIRIKVVQLLYSYLLTEKQFMLEDMPSQPTKEKRFAYALYLDMLALMVLTARNAVKRGGHAPLLDNRFISIVSADDKVKSLLGRSSTDFHLASIASQIAEEVKESGIFKKYAKEESHEINDDVRVWSEIFSLIFMRNAALKAVISQIPNYSARGVERMEAMMEKTFTNFLSAQSNIPDALKTLQASLDKARELYFRLLSLPVAITRLRDLQIDANRHKLLPTPEDLNPNMRFVENELAAHLAEEPEIRSYVEKKKCAWLPADEPIVTHLLRKIMDSDLYAAYMEAPATDLRDDAELWRNIFKHIIFTDSQFLETLEEKSIFWNDDIDIIGTFLLKTLKRIGDNQSEGAILDMYKDREDAEFGSRLFSIAVKNRVKYRELVNELVRTESWDADRLAFMDVVILIIAIAELMNFPKIPVKVTINEYIEMAKAYSTPKSGMFINGILGSLVTKLRADGKLTKE